ncbi:MAG TPA: hypothetical protein VFU53_09890 [Burkholderiales bacterium]|nr:hypothetical protein [Burkholderiales bacterium]
MINGISAVPPATARRRWLAAGLILGLAIAVLVFGLYRLATRPEFVEYKMDDPRDIPTAIAASPDGSVWFTIDSASAVGRLQDSKVNRLPKPTQNLQPIGLAVAADGSAWFTDAPAKQVSRMTPVGALTSVTLEMPIARLAGIAAAPDGSVWFAEGSAYSITRLKDGALKRHVIEPVRGGPYGVAVGPDGSVWATLQAANKVLRIGPDGTMRAFDIPTRGSSPSDIRVDAQGVVWFLEFRSNKLGRLENGKFQEFELGEHVAPTGLAVAPDGAVWFGMLRTGSLGRFHNGKIRTVKLPRENARPYGVAVDATGNVWYADISGYVGMLKR